MLCLAGKYNCDLLYILLGDGIFNVDGEQWRQQRKAASHMFTVNSLRYMDTAFERHARTLIDKLGRNLGTVIDAQEVKFFFFICLYLPSLFLSIALFGCACTHMFSDTVF